MNIVRVQYWKMFYLLINETYYKEVYDAIFSGTTEKGGRYRD